MLTLNCKREYLQSLTKDFPNDIIDSFGHTEDVLKDFGEEHYKLLAAISRQSDHLKILELGTSTGRSAIALTYGKRFGLDIELNTFDIVDLLFEQSRHWYEKYNVSCYLENLFDTDIREKRKSFILSHDIIFIDIDPHDGLLEYEMYIWLKNNDFKGILLFDDIHLNEGMREFWSKIDHDDKQDLTNVGHWSGTGLVTFHKNNKILLDTISV